MTAIALRPIDRQNWRVALTLSTHPEQQRFIADHAPIAAIVLAKAYVGAGGLSWSPYLIESDGQPIGLVASARHPGRADECWLYHFFIDREYQGRGYGTKALRAIIAQITAEYPDCHQIKLTVHPENTHAQQLYRGAGFAPSGEDGRRRAGLPPHPRTLISRPDRDALHDSCNHLC